MEALGMIEVYGYLSAVEALDSALKSANVTFHSLTKVTGGLVTVMVVGDVGAIKASMDAASASAERVGNVISVHVIPRPAESVFSMTKAKAKAENKIESKEDNKEIEVTDGNNANIADVEEKSYSRFKREALEQKTVEELRHIARALHMGSMTKNEIKFAKKKQLVDEICKFNERGDK